MIKLNSFIKKMVAVFFLSIISLIIILGNIENGILLTILSFVVIYFFVKKVKIKKFAIFLVCFSLITKIISVSVLDIPLRGDYYLMYYGSLDVLNGDLTFINGPYFSDFGYQLFNVFYQALVLKFFGNAFILKLLNCIYSTVITVLIYLFARKISTEDSARIVSLLYTISLYPLYLNSILGNQQLSLMFILLAVYIVLCKKNKFWYLVLAGFLLGLGNLERAEGIVYIFTIFAYLFLTSSNLVEVVKKFCPVVITYVLVCFLASFIMIAFNINKIGFKNNNPYWKVVCGLNYKYSGKFNYEDEVAYIHSKDAELEVIKDRFSDFKTLPGLFYRKIKVQFLYDDLDQTFNVNNTKQFSKDIVSIIINYIKSINIFVLLILLLGQLKKQKKSNIELFFLINLVIYFVVYLLIEVNARYYYNPQVAVIILATLGVDVLLKKLDNLKLKKYA